MIEGEMQTWQVAAGQDMTGDVVGVAVNLLGTITAINNAAVGINRSKEPSGVGLQVAVEGFVKCKMAAAITSYGVPIKVTTSGWITAAVSGDNTVGRFWQVTCASGDLALCNIDFRNIGYKPT